jgi:uncharacterized protein YjbJ (UPF0337 family)
MNRDRREGTWKQLSGKLMVAWGTLSNDPVRVVAGKHDQLACTIQEKHGVWKEWTRRQLKEC